MVFATGAITGIHPIGPGQHCRVDVRGGPSVELRTADARTLARMAEENGPIEPHRTNIGRTDGWRAAQPGLAATERDATFAKRIATRLGLPAAPIQKLPAGSVNHTFVVGQDDERCVIRFAVDPLRVDEFLAEAWCLRLASAHGIASPAVVAVGVLEGVPYAVHRFVAHLGQDAVDGRHLWTVLGRYARTIHRFPSPMTRQTTCSRGSDATCLRRGGPISPTTWPSSRVRTGSSRSASTRPKTSHG